MSKVNLHYILTDIQKLFGHVRPNAQRVELMRLVALLSLLTASNNLDFILSLSFYFSAFAIFPTNMG